MDDNQFFLSPVNFFQIRAFCKHLGYTSESSFPKFPKTKIEPYLLPDTSALCGETTFARVAMGWNEEGIEVYVDVHHPIEHSFFPDIQRGDSVELFFDTRDVKTSGFNTRFCHHFFFLPEAIEGSQAGEITRFRTEDAHEPCDPAELKVKTQVRSKNYSMQIFIPSQCLNGYDPEQFDRLGFTYRINRFSGNSQHFSVTSDDYQLEQQPSLWSSLQLTK
jgi:hypothetical protein